MSAARDSEAIGASSDHKWVGMLDRGCGNLGNASQVKRKQLLTPKMRFSMEKSMPSITRSPNLPRYILWKITLINILPWQYLRVDHTHTFWHPHILTGLKTTQIPTPVFLAGESHGQGNQEGYSPWDRKESDVTEYAHVHAHNMAWAVCKPGLQFILTLLCNLRVC